MRLCYNSNIGMANSTITCPLCNACINDTSRSKGLHALKAHNIEPKLLHALLLGYSSLPTCQCSDDCDRLVSWRGWKIGFNRFARGHMSIETRQEGKAKMLNTIAQHHWSRGKTKSNCASLKAMGQKTAETLKRKFASGEIKHWCVGKTAQTDPRIAQAAKKRSQTMSSNGHWHFMCNDDIETRLRTSLPNSTFTILGGNDDNELASRTSNVDYELTFICNTCGLVRSMSLYDVIRHQQSIRCPRCTVGFTSTAQAELISFVQQTTTYNTYGNDRTNPTMHELDVYVPSRKFAIEFNGLYWHSELVNKNKMYHQNKIVAAAANGITLMHVFEDEWRDRRNIVESMIATKLGKCEKRVFARKCTIVEITAQEARVFFDTHHVDGYVRAKKTYALKLNNDIVAAVSMRRPYSKKWQGYVEITRFASALNTQVVGGFSRLYKHILHEHPRVMCYVDRRWGGNGQHCASAGMRRHSETTPTFWWTDCHRRYNRLQCKASTGFSEKMNAERKRWVKIYGCSNFVYVSD